jgi:hypothetical protein
MTKPKIVLGAEVGISLDSMAPAQKTQLEWLLTVTSKPWKNNPSVTFRGFREENGYFWVPRQFAYHYGFTPDLDLRTTGTPQDLKLLAKLDPNRGQTEAVPAMVEYLNAHGSGILVAPTSTGKTLLSYAIASHFKTSIGVFIYVGHMMDNWIEQANLAFGLTKDDIGIVQQNQCDLGKPITLLSIQSLLSRRYPEELYNQIGFLVTDEIQHYGSTAWNLAISQFPAKWRLGVSADPSRSDGLEKIIEWNIGKIGHTIAKKITKLSIVHVGLDCTYNENSYRDYVQSNLYGEFVGDSLKYDKKLAADANRNAFLTEELLKARKQGRKVIMFSRLRDHLDDLKARFDAAYKQAKEQDPSYPDTKTDYLVGGMKKAQRDAAMQADVKFATYSYCRDAMNDTSLDTMFFCTPPGNPLQPAGRLRDKGPADRKPLLIVDPTEATAYSEEKWQRRLKTYKKLKFDVVELTRKLY